MLPEYGYLWEAHPRKPGAGAYSTDIFLLLKLHCIRNKHLYGYYFATLPHEIFLFIRFLPMVLIGRKKPTAKGKAIIGNNCYISTGVTILSPIRIGDNVTIGAGAVVTKDVPDGQTIVGIPAKSI